MKNQSSALVLQGIIAFLILFWGAPIGEKSPWSVTRLLDGTQNRRTDISQRVWSSYASLAAERDLLQKAAHMVIGVFPATDKIKASNTQFYQALELVAVW